MKTKNLHHLIDEGFFIVPSTSLFTVVIRVAELVEALLLIINANQELNILDVLIVNNDFVNK